MSNYLKNKDIFEIENHYKRFFEDVGAKDSGLVIHELVSDGMHIDIVHYLPTEKFPYHILATLGMSGYKMKGTPRNRMELIMLLPKDWKLEKDDLDKEENYWPIRVLKEASRLPYSSNSFFDISHTFSLDADFKPFDACTDMCVGLVTYPTFLNPNVFYLTYGKIFKKTVSFMCLTTLNKEEFNKKQELGYDRYFEEVLHSDGLDTLVVKNHR